MPIPWWTVIPFACLLGCIASFPLLPFTRRLWERPLFQLLLALGFGLPVALWCRLSGHTAELLHALVEYAQFIILLLSLFVVSGGIFVAGDIQATPRNNTIFLAIGTVMASMIGTTGAAMLLVRPILNTNKERNYKVHTLVFVIFLIANSGGLLTPLGDPPLFLGFLRGVPFLWTLHLLPQWLFVNGLLLVSYYFLDARFYAEESEAAIALDNSEIEPIRIKGRRNLLMLLGIVVAVALVPSVDFHAIHDGHARPIDYLPLREMTLLAVTAVSLLSGNKAVRYRDNNFHWAPILEVAALFAGIFLTMIPALQYLAQIAPSLPLNQNTLFLFTGMLSSVLDNAPTYATFFEMAKQLGGIPAVAGVKEGFLISISLGAVFCGACTYIGNGPNFMVKALAESSKVQMPSFGGYVARWVLPYYLPAIVLMWAIFISEDYRLWLLGVCLTVLRLGASAYAHRKLTKRKSTILRQSLE